MFTRPTGPEAFIAVDLVRRALLEDLGGGDVTTDCVVDATARGEGRIVARDALVVCGTEIAALVFHEIDPDLDVTVTNGDGQLLAADDELLCASGSIRALLKAERTALNILYHLCGIATTARRMVDAVAGRPVRVCDTRKTTPGLRVFEKYAARCGGAHNHRMTTADVVMIKDNHLATVSGIEEAIWRARTAAPHTARLLIECETLAQVEDAVRFGADVIVIDNMSPEMAGKAVSAVGKRALIEATGGITADNAAAYADAGVDVISSSLSFARERVDLGFDLDTGNS